MRRRSISDRTKDKYKKAVSRLISDLSKTVVVYKQPAKQECFNCYFDSLTNKSTGKCKWTAVEIVDKQSEWELSGGTGIRYKYFIRGRCPICDGKGYIEFLRKKNIKCIVNWAPRENDIIQTQAGLAGATPVLLKTDPSNIDLFKNCDKVVIDGIDCVISAPPMLRGIGNESVLFVMALTTKSVREPVSTERIKGYYD